MRCQHVTRRPRDQGRSDYQKYGTWVVLNALPETLMNLVCGGFAAYASE